MKYFHYILFLSLLAVSCTKNNVVIDENDTGLSQERGVLFFEGSPFSGTIEARFSDHHLKSQSHYRYGKLHGVQKKWYANRQLFSERNFQNGIKVGVHVGWWANGNKKYEFEFNDNGEHHGIANEWFENGQVFKQFNYQFGREEGSQKMYKPNGNLRANYVVVNGERFGLIGLKRCDAVSTM